MKRLEIEAPRGHGRPILLVSLVALSLIITTVWYREGDTGPLHATRIIVLGASTPFQMVGSGITAPFRAIGDWALGGNVTREQVAALRKANTELTRRLAELEEAKLENERIRALVKFAEAEGLPSVGSRVIGRSTVSYEGSIIIDRGTRDLVRVGAPVIAAGGLVGQVIEASPWSAKVRLVTSPDSGVAVLVQRTRATGVMRGSLDGGLWLDFVDKSKVPQRGDVLVTSGLGGVYPKGLVTGEVTDVTSARADLYPRIAVASRVAIGDIEEVLVLTEQRTDQQPGGGE